MTAQQIHRQMTAHGTMAALTMLAGRIDLADMEITKLMTAIAARGPLVSAAEAS